MQLTGGDHGAVFVDLGLGVAGGIDDGGRGSRLAADAHEIVEDALGGEILHDPDAGLAAGEAGGDHGLPERLQGPGDIDALAAGKRQALAGAVAETRLEIRHRQRAVKSRVECNGNDHLCESSQLPNGAGEID